MPLRVRLLVLILIAVLPAVAILLYNHRELRQVREAETHEEALRSADAVDDELQHIVAGARDLLLTIAHAPAVRDANWAACNSYLEELGDAYPAYSRLTVSDRTGRIVCASKPNAPGQSMADRAYFQAALAKDAFTVGTFTIGHTSGDAILPFAAPFHDREGQLAGVIINGLQLDWLAHQVERKLLPPEGVILIADRDGTILVRRPDQDRWRGQNIAGAFRSFFEAEQAGATDQVGIDDVRRIYGYVPVRASASGLHVGVGIGTAQALKPIFVASDRGLALIGGAGLLALVLCWLVADRFIRQPLHQLVTATYELGIGTYRRASLPEGSSDWDTMSRAFDAMAQTLASREAALRDSEARFQRLADATHEGVIIHDGDRIVEVNAGATRLTGYEPRELIGRPVVELIAPEMRQQALANVRAEVETRYETTGLRKDGSTFPVELTGRTIVYEGQPMRIVVAHDLTAHKRAEAALRQALERNEALLREGNHRIKNNLQLVSSLLGLQRRALRDKEARLALQEARRRIHAIARVHEGFYRTGEFDRIDFGDSLRALCSSLAESAREKPNIVIDVPTPCLIAAAQATPLALIANELITNALKHAFVAGQPGTIVVRCAVEPGGGVVLTVSDDGRGLPEDFEANMQRSFGMQLVRTLARQVGAAFHVQRRDPGMMAEIRIAPRRPTRVNG